MPNILDQKFKYVNAANTSLSKTFARIRRDEELAKKAAESVTKPNVVKLGSKK